MPERSKVRWSQLKVGVVAFVAMVILAVAIIPFRRYQTVRTHIADAANITKNAPVRLNGLVTGVVGGVKLSGSKDPQRAVELELKIRWRYMRDIPEDSLVTVTDSILHGSKSIEITKGLSRTPVHPGGELHGIVPAQDVPQRVPYQDVHILPIVKHRK